MTMRLTRGSNLGFDAQGRCSPYRCDSARQPAALVAVLLSAALGAEGCNRPQQAAPPTQSTAVVVSMPVEEQITDYEDFTGRTEAVDSIVVRARVTGYLDKVFFKEGTEVKEGERLFEIDRRTYQADCDRAEANLLQARARLSRLQADFRRAAALLTTRSMSQEDFDKVAGDRAEADAAVGVAQAVLNLANLNLGFTTVTAKVSGRISRQLIDPGNMVKADDTPLTTIVSLDPIYVYFDVDERTTLRVRRLIQTGKMKSARDTPAEIKMGLSDEEGFTHTGTIDFIDNRVDAATGTLWLRGLFPNPKRLLSPGLFVRVRVPIGQPHQAILVSERALQSDQGQKFLYVLNDKNEVTYRRVQLGALHNGLRAIENNGLALGERVIVSGLQRVRPGMKVEPKPEPKAAD